MAPDGFTVTELLKVLPSALTSNPGGAVAVMPAVMFVPETLKLAGGEEAVPAVVVSTPTGPGFEITGPTAGISKMLLVAPVKVVTPDIGLNTSNILRLITPPLPVNMTVTVLLLPLVETLETTAPLRVPPVELM